MAEWPTLDDYKAWARIKSDDTLDDAAITVGLAAVTAAVLARCPSLAEVNPLIAPAPVAVCPDDVAEAMLLWTNRLLARRNSPDGIVGVADLGVATVARFDRDIAQMLSPWLDPVLA